MRRIYIIAGVALVIIAAASYLAWALMRPTPEVFTEGATTTNIFTRLFPFGSQAPGSSTLVPGSNQEPATNNLQPVPRLRKISDKPVSGGAVFVVGTTSAIMIRYIERETGRVYETPAASPTVTRITNTTIPRIQKVLWIDVDHYIASYLSDAEALQNFYAALAPGKTEQSLNGTFMPSWSRAALDPVNKTLLTVTELADGSRFSLSRTDGTNARTVFTSPLRSWIPLQSSKSLYAATAPTSGVPSYLYQIVNGALIKVVGGIPGMMALVSPSGRYVALSSGGQNALALTVFDTKTQTYYPSPLATLASKCAWVSEDPVALICGVPTAVPAGAYPDDWLLGKAEFSDQIWGIEPVGNVTVLLSDPQKDASATIDLWQPSIAGSYLTFINKRDLSFWSFKFLGER